MFGFFGLLKKLNLLSNMTIAYYFLFATNVISWAIGSVYPVMASFRAYDSYSRLATKTDSTTFNVGGVSIPLCTLLKQPTSGEAEIEEDTLNCRLLSMQMWSIYWIVNAAISAAETALFLKWLPFYAAFRCGLSLWLIAPILVTSSRLKHPQMLSYYDTRREWANFSGQGCGYVYFRFLRPFLDEKIVLLGRVRLEPLLASVSGKFVLPIAQYLGILTVFGGDLQADLAPASYTEKLSDYTKAFMAGGFGMNAPVPDPADENISEYDVVDKPEESVLRNRDGAQNGPHLVSPTGEDVTPASTGKQSWFW